MKKSLFLSIIIVLIFVMAGCGSDSGGTTEYTLTIDISGQGSVEPSSGSEFKKDTVVTLNPIPDQGWEFDRWGGPDASSVAGNKITMTRDMHIEAIFKQASKVATPQISPAQGTYYSAQQVTITCNTTGADIYYTTDGSTPDKNSTKYTGSFQVTQTTTVKAIACKQGYTVSDVATADLTLKSIDIAYIHGSNIITEAYHQFFKNSNYNITNSTIKISNIPATDFTAYDLIVISPDAQINDAQMVTILDNTSLPVLGLGYGGRDYFEQIGLFIGNSNYHANINGLYQIKAGNTGHNIWNTPNEIDISSGAVTCYEQTEVTNDTSAVLDYSSTMIPGNVSLLGEVPAILSFYLLLEEDEKYLLWGFGASPADLTADGKDLFMNCIIYLVS